MVEDYTSLQILGRRFTSLMFKLVNVEKKYYVRVKKYYVRAKGVCVREREREHWVRGDGHDYEKMIILIKFQ